ncbi:hypothetical protein DY000_02057036 [Brassica cretica]|uniref:Uncharacterized protein n=1 Tax=Brassica cretica TaxID=69181 RepID=A0ABQ7A5Z0_BRACR|nr:hypothetical protein DY000_02057036 [Brassica cretica]
MGFKIDEIVQAWNEMYDAKRWQIGVPSFRLEPLFRRRSPKLHDILENVFTGPQYCIYWESWSCNANFLLFLMIKHSSSKIKINFLKYEQSSQCQTMRDSSVSYASAAAKSEC